MVGVLSKVVSSMLGGWEMGGREMGSLGPFERDKICLANKMLGVSR